MDLEEGRIWNKDLLREREFFSNLRNYPCCIHLETTKADLEETTWKKSLLVS